MAEAANEDLARFKRQLLLVLGGATLLACSARPVGPDPIAACTERGIAYFKEIGAYPTLTAAPNKGRAAEDVARERCERSSHSFPD
jgi:hypothetical protein